MCSKAKNHKPIIKSIKRDIKKNQVWHVNIWIFSNKILRETEVFGKYGNKYIGKYVTALDSLVLTLTFVSIFNKYQTVKQFILA